MAQLPVLDNNTTKLDSNISIAKILTSNFFYIFNFDLSENKTASELVEL